MSIEPQGYAAAACGVVAVPPRIGARPPRLAALADVKWLTFATSPVAESLHWKDVGMRATVRDVMTKTPLTIDPEAPVATAVAVMRERGLRHLPVADDDQRLIGILSDRDLRSVIRENLRVRDVMTWHVITTGPAAPIAQAAAVMTTQRIGCLPVIECGRLVGIVTAHDALKVLASTLSSVRGDDPDNYFW
jgi:CBS domain-containing protein